MRISSINMVWRRVLPNLLQKAIRRKYVILLVLLTLGVSFYSFNSGGQTAYKYSMNLWLFGEKTLSPSKQSTLDYISQHVRISYTVVDNLYSGQRFGQSGNYLTTFTMSNGGQSAVPPTRWQLHGYFIRLVEPSLYPYKYGIYIIDCGLKLFHIGGNLYRFEPAGGLFEGLQPGANLTCTLQVKGFQVARTDSMPNWFVTGVNLVPKIIQSTAGEDLQYVSAFDQQRQYLRRKDDKFKPYSVAERYKLFSSVKESVVPVCNIIPTPLEVNVDQLRVMDFSTNGWVVVMSSTFRPEVTFLADSLKMKTSTGAPLRRYIRFIKGPITIQINGKSTQPEEAYSLETDVTRQIITITSNTNKGAFYGIQSLQSLVFTPEARTAVGVLVRLPALKIVDAPRFEYRGLHIDVSRNFHTKNQLLKTIEVMSLYKMNKLHLHLTDDEGWRLEIPGLPELTQIGSKRCYDPEEEQCILPMLGSGPDFNTSGSGYYDVGDYKEILTFARSRHVDVIPEFDMPGHSRAAIKSIHAKSQQSHRRKMKTELYSVLDKDDYSEYISGQHFTDDVMNPCVESTYKFVRKLMLEVKRLHEDVQPLKMFHFGGDEVAKGAWSNSTACKQLQERRSDLKTEYDLMKYFIVRMAAIASDLDIVLGAWEDGVISHGSRHDNKGLPFRKDELQNNDIYAYVWKRPSEPRTPHRSRLLVNNGYKVVLSYGSYLYFDHPYEPDPEERGLYWATRKISTRDVWSFTPDVMQDDLELTCPGNVKDKTDCYQVKHPENIVGMQAQLWTETVRTSEQMDYMLFPRLLAVAERAWHTGSWEGSSSSESEQEKHGDWLEFVHKVGYRELRRLETLGVKYRISPPGAVVKEGRVSFSTEFPGQDIEYFNNKESAWEPVYHNMPIRGSLRIRTSSYDKLRVSREVVIHTWDTLRSSQNTIHSSSYIILLVVLSWLLT